MTTYTAGRPDRGRHARTRTLVSVVGHCIASCSSCCWVRTSVLLAATSIISEPILTYARVRTYSSVFDEARSELRGCMH